MLRTMFHEPPRNDEGRVGDILALLEELSARYRSRPNGEAGMRAQRLLAWTKSLASSFDELEQSVFCAVRYAERVRTEYVEEMGPEERTDFRRHLYFYKNSFIRVFSVLDKLGSFLNDNYSLRTERIKERYSYFTVLRSMREKGAEPELWNRLNDIKREFREQVQDLRLMRNHEVHAVNTELLDEDGRLRLRPHDRRQPVEDLRRNVETLLGGFAMVSESLFAAADYCKRRG